MDRLFQKSLVPAASKRREQLRVDFCCDVLRHLCEEWRLSRGTVLRWVRGWYAEHGITALPQAVAQLPPIDTFDG